MAMLIILVVSLLSVASLLSPLIITTVIDRVSIVVIIILGSWTAGLYIHIYIYRERERYTYIYIYIYAYSRGGAAAALRGQRYRAVLGRELMVGCSGMWCFRMWGFNMCSKPLTHISFRCEVLTPSVVEGQSTIMCRPHILKPHIPELPRSATKCSKYGPIFCVSKVVWGAPEAYQFCVTHFPASESQLNSSGSFFHIDLSSTDRAPHAQRTVRPQSKNLWAEVSEICP